MSGWYVQVAEILSHDALCISSKARVASIWVTTLSGTDSAFRTQTISFRLRPCGRRRRWSYAGCRLLHTSGPLVGYGTRQVQMLLRVPESCLSHWTNTGGSGAATPSTRDRSRAVGGTMAGGRGAGEAVARVLRDRVIPTGYRQLDLIARRRDWRPLNSRILVGKRWRPGVSPQPVIRTPPTAPVQGVSPGLGRDRCTET